MSPKARLERQDATLKQHKRLGQYFSGQKVSSLLVRLCEVEAAGSLLDPMAGSGDILFASRHVMAPGSQLAGIELDESWASHCSARMVDACVIAGSAFSPGAIRALPAQAWQRVITNPPYVRYQSQASRKENVPSALDVRNGLIQSLAYCSALDDDDRHCFRLLAEKYSGLADLAVPSVLLCAALTEIDGIMGLVMPESWLTREYAAPIRYVLNRWFQIVCVVEDAHAVWFSDAQIKTSLIVARRTLRRASALTVSDKLPYPKLRISGAAMNESSLVGRAFPNSPDPDLEFARDVLQLRDGEPLAYYEYVESLWETPAAQATETRSAVQSAPWLAHLEPNSSIGGSAMVRIPTELSSWLAKVRAVDRFTSLDELGVNVGQGLRTGANSFFYVPNAGIDRDKQRIGPLPLMKNETISVRRELTLPVLIRQAELPDGYVVGPKDASNVALVIGEPLVKPGKNGTTSAVRRVDSSLAALIGAAQATNYGTADSPKKISELSAVAPNQRESVDGRQTERHWYMLPKMTHRHRPVALVPRVNGRIPRTYLNSRRQLLVDANFSTLWIDRGSPLDRFALLALMNSSFVLAAMELSASIMGGGAAKIEAAHIRKLPIPDGLACIAAELSQLGQQLVKCKAGSTESVLRQIDGVIISLLIQRRPSSQDISSLRELVTNAYSRRSRKSKRSN